MPLLSHLSRRFHMLTTDATPDPPRVGIPGYTHNLESSTKDKESKENSKSNPATPEFDVPRKDVTSTAEEKPFPNGAVPTCNDYSSTKASFCDTQSATDTKEQKRPNIKTKARSKQYKCSQGTNVVNYNIVNSNGVKIGPKTSYICNVNHFPASKSAPSEASWSKPKSREMPANVERLCGCLEEITLDDIFVIKTHVGHGWRDVARRLSYSDGQIDQFEENYRLRGIDEVIYQLLLDWKQANTKDAEIGNLVSVLWACQEYDCAERLAAAHKNPY